MEGLGTLMRAACRSSRRRQLQCVSSRRFIQASAAHQAQTWGPSVPGPSPATPAPIVEPDDAVTRKRKQADILRKAQALRADPAKPTSTLRKRFWKDVSVKETQDGLQIMLDSRPVRTPTKAILTVPHSKHHLATAIAIEWDLLVSAQQALKQHYIPLTSMTARALDLETADSNKNTKIRNEVVDMAMRYLSTDTLLCWAPEAEVPRNFTGESLRSRQKRIAEDVIGELNRRVWPGVEIRPVEDETSILPSQQPEATKEAIRSWLYSLPAWELAALERSMLASKSLLVAVRLLANWSPHLAEGHGPGSGAEFGIEEAAEACSLEVRYQTEIWGEVEDTHDVEKEDLRRQLGSAILLVNAAQKVVE